MTILLFILAAVAMRFMPHVWNFTPVIAMLLLAGAYMKSRQLWIPIAALIGSDFALNVWVYRAPGGLAQYFCWAAYLAVLGLAYLALKGRLRVPVLLGTTVLSSSLFFLISNFGVWLGGYGYGEPMYPRTWAGLVECYAMGVPFFRSALAGDLLFTAVFFSLYAWLRQRQTAPATAA